ncbi:MAG: OmpA family protein [Myxococcales bacterium]|nr:OmpA family protein [Myxococcales bacterium]MCB9733167.1 OmpA family protein [Deltaproteobacteria bacterium]
MAAKPKPAFYVAVFLVIAGLVAFALWRLNSGGSDTPKPDQKTPEISKTDLEELQKPAEAPDGQGITTVKEYSYVPSEKLPDVKGVSDYSALGDERVVRFAINVWAGWAPIIHANQGFKPGKVWTDADGKPFKVELVLIDDPVAMRDAFASGNVHIGWATVDMLPLLLEGLQKDSRTMPRVYQQIDWSNGGDGIVARENIKTMSDLRGKTVVLAQNSPSQYFVLNALINSGVQPSEVNFKYTQDAFQAAAAFNADKGIAACVSWAPDIYNLSDVAGNKLLVSTQTANKLIADVWFARADFAKDNAAIIEGIVRGIFDSMEELKGQDQKVAVSKWMADGYSIPESDTLGMLGDAHWTNFAENKEFFMNQNNPTSFERTYNTAFFLYKRIAQVGKKVPFDQIADWSLLAKLGKEAKYGEQKDEYTVRFAPATATEIQGEADEILTKTIVIHFYPNSWDIEKTVTKDAGGKTVEELYDPNAQFVVNEAGELAGQFGAARIVIEGHTDSSMKGQIPDTVVKELATNRANAVKEAIIKKFPTLEPNQFATKGVGWDRPADPNDPMNHAKNRRVEVKVYPAEKPN